MAQSTRASGASAWLREQVVFLIQTGTPTRESGATTKRMVTAFTKMLRELTMKGISKMTCNTARVLKSGMKGQNMRACINTAKKKELVNTLGQMGHTMRGSGWTTRSMGMVVTFKWMGNATMGNG